MKIYITSQKLHDTGKNVVNELYETNEQNKPQKSHVSSFNLKKKIQTNKQREKFETYTSN